MNGTLQKLADAAGPVGFSTWVIMHIAEINSILQTVLLLASIGATLAAWRYHHRKTKRSGMHR